MSNKDELIKVVKESNKDIEKLILDCFKHYKRTGKNHDEERDSLVTDLIRIYYDLGYKDICFNNMKKSFVKKYILNESKLEGVNPLSLHGKQELEGLLKMYQYMHSDKIEANFNILTLRNLHKELYSCTPYPEFGGNFRTTFTYLRGAKTDICDWTKIYPSLLELNDYVFKLRELAPMVKEVHHSKEILRYLDKCSELSCKLIKIHPFVDGNGRTVRCFINKLMEDGGLPSVYVKNQERLWYFDSMRKAMDDEDYSHINMFYRYKVCDSIVELDINDRLLARKTESRKQTSSDAEKVKIYTSHENR